MALQMCNFLVATPIKWRYGPLLITGSGAHFERLTWNLKNWWFPKGICRVSFSSSLNFSWKPWTTGGGSLKTELPVRNWYIYIYMCKYIYTYTVWKEINIDVPNQQSLQGYLSFPPHQLSNHLSISLRSPPFLRIYLFIMYTLPYDILHVAIYKGYIDIQ